MLIIMIGISGSGKSTWARENAPGARVVSADHHFTGADGVYRFDPARLGEAHAACFRAACEAVRDLADPASDSLFDAVLVDNTNTTEIEIAPYVALGAAYGVPVKLVRMLCPAAMAAARNTHGVPLAGVEAQDKRIRALRIPPFWRVHFEEVRFEG